MLKVAFLFFAIAMAGFLFSGLGLMGSSVEIGKSVSMLFLALAVNTFVVSLVSSDKSTEYFS